jgi:hypothetical protein
MNKFKFYFILSITTLSLFSCSKNNDSAEVTPPRDFAVQYATDITDIEEYLNTYYFTVVDHPGVQDDQDVTISKITDEANQPSIYSYLNATTFPKLLIRPVSLHDITYNVYYLVLREGTGVAPCNVDGVLASYKGDYLQQTVVSDVTSLTATTFEETKYPQRILSLFSAIKGWSEIFPKFKTGSYVANGDGTLSYNDFGAGVMFIPSGLAYFASGQGTIPAYAPLVFSFKLYEIQRLDQDSDGVPSFQEDVDGDGYMSLLATGVFNPDDTDGDGIPNFADVDDDGDGYSTRSEIKNPATGSSYSFADIPSCDGNTTDEGRSRKHLDKSCH